MIVIIESRVIVTGLWSWFLAPIMGPLYKLYTVMVFHIGYENDVKNGNMICVIKYYYSLLLLLILGRKWLDETKEYLEEKINNSVKTNTAHIEGKDSSLHSEWLPLLAKLAGKYLVIPASSTKSERVFSAGGRVVTSCKTSLEPGKVEALFVINRNKGQLNK